MTKRMYKLPLFAGAMIALLVFGTQTSRAGDSSSNDSEATKKSSNDSEATKKSSKNTATKNKDAKETLPPWKTTDIIDKRIAVAAQYSLMRKFNGDTAEQVEASAIMSAIDSGTLGGIYIAYQKEPALRAKALGFGWWKLIPKNQDAICMNVPSDKLPILVLRNGIEKDKARVDRAITAAWNSCDIEWAPPRGYQKNLPNKQPRKENERCETKKGSPVINVSVIEDGKPVPNVKVSVGSDFESSASKTTDKNGNASFGGLKAGTFHVVGEFGGYPMTLVVAKGNCTYPVLLNKKGSQKKPTKTCKQEEWHESFNTCGKKILFEKTFCLAKVYKVEKDCKAACMLKRAQEFFKDCYVSPAEAKKIAQECTTKANKKSGCSF